VFVANDNIELIIGETQYLSTAWDIANLYLGSSWSPGVGRQIDAVCWFEWRNHFFHFHSLLQERRPLCRLGGSRSRARVPQLETRANSNSARMVYCRKALRKKHFAEVAGGRMRRIANLEMGPKNPRKQGVSREFQPISTNITVSLFVPQEDECYGLARSPGKPRRAEDHLSSARRKGAFESSRTRRCPENCELHGEAAEWSSGYRPR
jgi:hypothetical protein